MTRMIRVTDHSMRRKSAACQSFSATSHPFHAKLKPIRGAAEVEGTRLHRGGKLESTSAAHNAVSYGRVTST